MTFYFSGFYGVQFCDLYHEKSLESKNDNYYSCLC